MAAEQSEQEHLAGLEARYQWTKTKLERHMPTNRPATLEELKRAADYASTLVDWFRTVYGPIANSLQAVGFSRLPNRLNTIMSDLGYF